MAAVAIAHLACLPPFTPRHSRRPASRLNNWHCPISSTSLKNFLQLGIVPRASSSSAPSLVAQVPELADSDRCELQQSVQHSTGMLLGDASFVPQALLTTAAALVPVLLDCQEAWAINGEFGILEGRSLALVHPIIMGSLFLYTLRAGYLGWQWRRVRTIQDEINQLKKDVPPKEDGAPPSPAEIKIKELTEVRKELLKGGFRDRHWNAGSILLGFGVFEAVGGCVNTWFRTGKLFPGPHLFAGAGIAVLWALAASLVPAMQRGDETARSLHIGLNTLNVVLFLWQIPTGWDIVLKVLQFTSWP